MTVIFAILFFSFMIAIHELGHFVAAKLSGVQVNEFSLFMGPAIFKKQVGETLYALRCIPLGGYCAMEGEDGDSDNPRAFTRAAWWKRLIILAAGAFMNFVAGLLIFVIIFLPEKQIMAPVISSIEECCIFEGEDGLMIGDEFLEIDGEKVYVMGDVSMLLSVNKTGIHDMVVLRDGQKIVISNRQMSHTHVDENGVEYAHYGFGYGEVRDLDLGERIANVWANAVDTVRNVRLSLQMLLTGKAGVSDMMGPVGIVDMMNDVAQESATTQIAVLNVLYFGGMIAINLAVMNLLPIPALDGGRIAGLLVTTVIEKITKKKIDPKYEGYIHGGFLIALMILMALIMFKDVFNLFK